MPYHVVKPGECLTRIAHRYGFSDYRTIYEHQGNKSLRKLRPDPNLLHPGDQVFIPKGIPKTATCATRQLHKFVVQVTKRVLRLAITGLDGKRVTDTPYELIIDGTSYYGTTTSNGLVEQSIPTEAEAGSVQVGDCVWPIRIGHLNPIEDTADDGVSGIQGRLRNLGYDVGPIDHKLGPRTRAAIRAFQRAHPPLVVDGVCGPKTRAKLYEKHGC